jgi:PAS domain S-box-containing protein
VSSADPDSLALLASIAKLLNAGLGIEATLAAVAEALRAGLPAERVTIWFREPSATAFRAVAAPGAAGAWMALDSLEAVPHEPSLHRLPLEQEGTRLGLLTARLDRGDTGLGVLRIVADFLAPYVASAELSTDLAGEVAEQSREIEEHRRFTSLIIDTLPLGLYVVDREYRIQTWNRKRETGTQGLRREVVVGRRIFDVLTRQDPGRLRSELDRVFQTGEIQQTTLEVALGGESRFYRLSKIPMRLDSDEITHVITIGEDVTDWHVIQARIMQSEKLAAIGQLAAGVMHEINNPLATIGACVAAIQGRIEPATSPVALDSIWNCWIAPVTKTSSNS